MRLTFRLQACEVPKVVMRTLALRNVIVRFWLDCMDNIRKLDCVLDKENWNIISDDIPISFLSVKLHGEPADVADGVLTGAWNN
jgi:hypothetical protein